MEPRYPNSSSQWYQGIKSEVFGVRTATCNNTPSQYLGSSPGSSDSETNQLLENDNLNKRYEKSELHKTLSKDKYPQKLSGSSKIVKQVPSQITSPNSSQLIFRNESRDVPQCGTNKNSQNNVSISTQEVSHENRATNLSVPKNGGQNTYGDKVSSSGLPNAPENSSPMRSRDIFNHGLHSFRQKAAEYNYQDNVFEIILPNNPLNGFQEKYADSICSGEQKGPQKITENCFQNKFRDTLQGPMQKIQPNLLECSFENKSTEAISSRLQKVFQIEPGRGLEKSSTENNFNLSQKLQENIPGNILEGSYQNKLPSPPQEKPEIISQNRVPNTTEKVPGSSRLIEISIPISTSYIKTYNFSLPTSRHIFHSGSQTLQHKVTENKHQDKISDPVLNSLQSTPKNDFRVNLTDFCRSGVQKEPQKVPKNYAENKSRVTLQGPIQNVPKKLPEGCFENKSTELLRTRLPKVRQKEHGSKFENNSADNNLSLSQNVPQKVPDSSRGSNLPGLTSKTLEGSYENQLLTSTEKIIRQNRISKTTEFQKQRQIETPISTQKVPDSSHHVTNLSDGVPEVRHRNMCTDQFMSGLQNFSQKKQQISSVSDSRQTDGIGSLNVPKKGRENFSRDETRDSFKSRPDSSNRDDVAFRKAHHITNEIISRCISPSVPRHFFAKKSQQIWTETRAEKNFPRNSRKRFRNKSSNASRNCSHYRQPNGSQSRHQNTARSISRNRSQSQFRNRSQSRTWTRSGIKSQRRSRHRENSRTSGTFFLDNNSHSGFCEKPNQWINFGKDGYICSAYLNGDCKETDDSCSSYHPPSKTTFAWQLKSPWAEFWNYFNKSTNEFLEEEFCDPNQETVCVESDDLSKVYDFEGMIFTKRYKNREKWFQIRRIEARDKYRTPWNYFWKNKQNQWKMFYRSPDRNNGISCNKIDRAFCSASLNETSIKHFSIYGKKYVIHIQKKTERKWSLYETDSNSKLVSEIRRRPRRDK